jgi:DNA polymerase III epsilon subunit-like protein
MSQWFKDFSQHFVWPDDYSVIDTETSGVHPETCFPCMLGITVVRDRKPVETSEIWLDWWREPNVDHALLEQQLLDTQRIMEADGKTFHHTKERLRARGQAPKPVFEALLARLEAMEAHNEFLVGHNVIKFDIEFIQAVMHNFLRVPFVFRTDLLMDTGLLVKASQMADFPSPRPDETVYAFLRRVARTPRKGVKWALNEYCEKRFELCKKANSTAEQAHAAGADSLLTHVLFEELRELASG